MRSGEIQTSETPKKESERGLRKQAYIVLAVGIFMLLLSFVFAGLNIARMRRFEREFVRVTATVTGMRTDHIGGGSPKSIYRLVYTYELDGRELEGTDTISRFEAYEAADGRLLGTQTKLYANPQMPGEVYKVSSADVFSVVSAVLFAIGVFPFAAGVLILLRGKRFPFLVLSLSIAALSFCTVLLFWLGFPGSGFAAAFAGSRGAIGYTVVGAAALICALTDGILIRKGRKR